MPTTDTKAGKAAAAGKTKAAKKPSAKKAAAADKKSAKQAAKAKAPAAKKTAANKVTAARKAAQTETMAGARRVTAVAEKAVLVPVGAGLTLGDELVGSAKDLAAKTQAQARLERFERRGASARTDLEKRVAIHRGRVGDDLDARRRSVEGRVKRDRNRLEGEVRQFRAGIESEAEQVRTRIAGLGVRVEELLSNARGAIR